MRQYTTAYIEIPKKQGKSELGAAIALNMLVNDDEWKAEVLGIREFIETVEPEQLTVLNQRNPKLFQDFLPFAYVLNLADIWAKKFEHLPVEQPQWYDGMHDYDHFDTFLFWHTFHYCFYYMEQYTVYHPLIKEAGFFHVSFHTFLPKQKK